MLSFQKYTPKLLKQFITGFYIYHFDENVDIQLLPKGVFEIIFQSNAEFQHNTSYSSGWENRPRNFVGGLHNKSYYVRANESNSFCVVVEFKPETAKYFIPCQLHDLQNNVVDIFELWGGEAAELSQRVYVEKTDIEKINLIEQFLLNKIIGHNASKIDKALSLIVASQGFSEVCSLAKEIGLSNSQFRKRFKEEIGISPSQYCKIVRINTTLAVFREKDQRPLIELSNQLGYFDQSHFIKDFKSVTGCSPSNYK